MLNNSSSIGFDSFTLFLLLSQASATKYLLQGRGSSIDQGNIKKDFGIIKRYSSFCIRLLNSSRVTRAKNPVAEKCDSFVEKFEK